MSHSLYEFLLDNLRCNDVISFQVFLEFEGLPQDDHYYDYDLLMRPLRLSRKKFVKLLLAKKCRVNKPRHLNIETNSPLHLAAKKFGWCNIVEKMLKLKARVTDVNADGNTPIHLAFINNASDKVIKLLLNDYRLDSTLDIRNKDGLGLMHIACMKAEAYSVQRFFDNGMSDIYSQVSSLSDSIYAGYSCLHFAVEAGNHSVVKFLCGYEADVYAQDRNRTTPIHLALEKRDVQMIRTLFYYDSKYENYVNDCGLLHFMAAIVGSYRSVIEKNISVIEESANSYVQKLLTGRVKNIPDYPFAGYTVLHFACEYGRLRIVERQIELGVHLSLTMQKLTPLDLARKNNHEDICDTLLEHCDNCESCNDLIYGKVKPEILIETKSTHEKEDVIGSRSVAVLDLLYSPTSFFARTFTVTNFLWLIQMTNFTMRAKTVLQICQLQTDKSSQSMGRRMSLLLGTRLLCMFVSVY